jgi:hypothetical protein
MERLHRASTKSTPEVDFNADTHKLVIFGDSFPENAQDFYNPVISWLEHYFRGNPRQTHLEFNFFYLNTSSSKIVTDILEMLQQAHSDGVPIQLTWFYFDEDDDSRENAEIFLEDHTFPYSLAPYREE